MFTATQLEQAVQTCLQTIAQKQADAQNKVAHYKGAADGVTFLAQALTQSASTPSTEAATDGTATTPAPGDPAAAAATPSQPSAP